VTTELRSKVQWGEERLAGKKELIEQTERKLEVIPGLREQIEDKNEVIRTHELERNELRRDIEKLKEELGRVEQTLDERTGEKEDLEKELVVAG